jgi:hypothetical protein
MGKNGFGASVLGGKLLVVAGGPGSTSWKTAFASSKTEEL